MRKLIKPIDSISYTEEVVKDNLKTVSGSDLEFILSPKSGTTYSHLWLGPLFSLPVNNKMEEEFITPYVDGGVISEYSDGEMIEFETIGEVNSDVLGEYTLVYQIPNSDYS